MSWVDKIKKMTGNDPSDDYNDDENYYNTIGGDEYDIPGGYDAAGQNYAPNYAPQPMAEQAPAYQPASAAMNGMGTMGGSTMGAPSSFSSVGGSAIELKVVKPDRFDCVPQIADHLLNKRTVVLNLEATNKETARRLIDFLSGVAYSIDGQLKRIANNAYVITPSNVDVSGEQLQDKPKAQEAAPAPQPSGDFYSDI